MPGISMPGISALVSTAMSMRVSLNAMAMAVTVAAMTSPAEADFLYVPPRDPVAPAESRKDPAPAVREAETEKNARGSDETGGEPAEAATHTDRIDAHRRERSRRVAAPLRVETPLRVAAPGHADAEPLERSGSAGLWQVRAGEMLREALDRWGDRAGVEVLFLTDRRYRLHEGRAFEGSFDEAAMDLFSALSHLPHPPAGELRPDGRTLAVMHGSSGMRPAGDGR